MSHETARFAVQTLIITKKKIMRQK